MVSIITHIHRAITHSIDRSTTKAAAVVHLLQNEKRTPSLSLLKSRAIQKTKQKQSRNKRTFIA